MNSVKIISITNPLIDGIETAQDLISYCARVSNPKNQLNIETSEKLLNYCIKNKHWSIFEMVNVVFEVKTTRDIGRQILRHSLHPQEFSQRYQEISDEFVLREARLQDKKNRQNSLEIEDDNLQQQWNAYQQKVVDAAKEAYQWALKNNIAKEQARVVLPEGMTLSTMYLNGTLRNWIHYTEVRRDLSTQKEHREIANLIFNQLLDKFPFLKQSIYNM